MSRAVCILVVLAGCGLPSLDDAVGDTASSTGLATTPIAAPEASACTNVLGDSGFEAGSPNPFWVESSLLFGSPLCNAGCSDDAGARAARGQWWAWFGGQTSAELAWVAQSFVIPPRAPAALQFQLAVEVDDARATDSFWIEVDGLPMFAIRSDDGFARGYASRRVDLRRFADGQRHTVMLMAELEGQAVTSFFVDDVTLMVCSPSAGQPSPRAPSPSESTSTTGRSTMGDDSSGDEASGSTSGTDGSTTSERDESDAGPSSSSTSGEGSSSSTGDEVKGTSSSGGGWLPEPPATG